MSRKGVEMALGVVVTVVVLVVVSLAVITIATSGAAKTGADSQTQIGEGGCQIAVRAVCGAQAKFGDDEIEVTSSIAGKCSLTEGTMVKCNYAG